MRNHGHQDYFVKRQQGPLTIVFNSAELALREVSSLKLHAI